MKFSEDTEILLSILDEYTEHSLRKRGDLGAIVELSARHDAAEKFNYFVFTGKVVWNIFNTMRKSSSSEHIQHLEKEFVLNLNRLREQILFFETLAPEEIQTRWRDTYLATGQGITRNLVDFSHDLARCKDLQNESRHRNSQETEEF